MDYLSRDSAPFGEKLWNEIDDAVVEAARRNLIGRRFLTVFGPLGAGAQSAVIDGKKKSEIFEDRCV